MFIMALKSVFENPFFVLIAVILVVVVEQLIAFGIAVMVLQMVERLIRIAVCAKHVIIQAVVQIVGKIFALSIIIIKKNVKNVGRNIVPIPIMIALIPANFVEIR